MAKQFRVSFTADETKLPILIGLLAGEVDGFHVQDMEKTPTLRQNGIYKKRDFDRSKIRPVIEWPSAKAIMEFLQREGVASSRAVCLALSKAGFGHATGAALLSKLKKEGYVRVVSGMEDGRAVNMFCIVPKEK